MKLNTSLRRVASLPVLAASMLPAAAFAQATPADPADFDQTKIVDAVNTGLANGIAVLLAIAPIVIAFAVVWMVINRGKGMAKSG